jgi:hypothetical protein
MPSRSGPWFSRRSPLGVHARRSDGGPPCWRSTAEHVLARCPGPGRSAGRRRLVRPRRSVAPHPRPGRHDPGRRGARGRAQAGAHIDARLRARGATTHSRSGTPARAGRSCLRSQRAATQAAPTSYLGRALARVAQRREMLSAAVEDIARDDRYGRGAGSGVGAGSGAAAGGIVCGVLAEPADPPPAAPSPRNTRWSL